MKPHLKFGILIAIVVATLGWLAVGGVNESKTYYKTVAEIQQMGNHTNGKRLRVGGDVVKGSIVRQGNQVSFHLKHMDEPGKAPTPNADGRILRVVYRGSDPLPDTFRDGAQALADGQMSADGSFEAHKIQAKCASKYEAKPGQVAPGAQPTNNTKSSRS
jgi:cytochrome c-type biogenesis protein CcmE